MSHVLRDLGEPIFVDTSGIYAVLDAGDVFHDRAGKAWHRWVDQDVPLVTTNYVVLEATALLRNRLGIDAAKSLHRAMVPMLQVEWVTRAIHEAGVNRLLGVQRRRLSLVDCISFEMMDILEFRHAFSFDAHFAEHGFYCIP
jgi:predicted nucleic acid-binding protein